MTKPRIVVSASPGDSQILVVPVWQAGESVEVAAPGAGIKVAESVQQWATRSGFKGSVGEVALIPNGERAVAAVGLGTRDGAGPTEIRRAAGTAARRLTAFPTAHSLLHQAVQGEAGTRAAVEGFLLGAYRFDKYKAKDKPSRLEQVTFQEAEEDHLARGEAVADAVMLARDLVNEPPSILTPPALAERCGEIASAEDLEHDVIEAAELAERGFGGITGVARGSAEPPVLIRLRYSGGGGRKVALVGKGITFDSGGLSLKDAKGMETMKTDMSGAAAVIGAISAAARMRLPVDVTAYVPASENMPGHAAIKPGDVITHYGGKTTEVLNTDAEGRLVLGDAIALACEEGAQTVVDVATLTGSIMVALGKDIAGLFTNDESLRETLVAAAGDAGEIMWPMPLHRSYKKELESEIADQKNVGSRYGGSITAALFLNEFVADGVAWAHLDIAGIARSESESEHLSKGGTGLATPTLIRWLEASHG